VIGCEHLEDVERVDLQALGDLGNRGCALQLDREPRARLLDCGHQAVERLGGVAGRAGR
jgi:hypothetical protein